MDYSSLSREQLIEKIEVLMKLNRQLSGEEEPEDCVIDQIKSHLIWSAKAMFSQLWNTKTRISQTGNEKIKPEQKIIVIYFDI